MADGDDQQPQQRYWFPYWSGQPQPPPPPPSRPPVRPQMSRRPSQHVAPSPPRRASSQHHHQPTTTVPAAAVSRGGAAPPPPAQAPQVSRPSPSRASPLAPIREPPPPPASNSNAGAAAPPPKQISRPVAPLAAREAAPKFKDVDVVDVPQEKTVVQQPVAGIKLHGKATDKEHKAPKDKEETKSKEKEETKNKEKEKEKEEKEKKDESKSEKEKEKKHHVEDSSEKKKSHGGEQGKLQKEIKAGVADLVHKASRGGASSGSAGSTSVITLAGENKGASMKVGAGAAGKEQGLHGRRLDGKEAAAGEGCGGKQKGMMRALVNSNVQVINSSLLLQSSCSGGDPGIHLKLSARSKSKDKQQRHAGDVTASSTTTAAKK